MLHVFGFDRVGVAVGDLYFVDPRPGPGQEGHEHGVRLELRHLERGDLIGSIYSAQPIALGAPIWRVDLFETVTGPAGSFDRTHHHPAFTGWEPERRHFDAELSADPFGWLARRLGDLDAIVVGADVVSSAIGPTDAEDMRAAVPEIVEAVRRLLARVRAGELARPPEGAVDDLVGVRAGWL